jgi:hypothetical protein
MGSPSDKIDPTDHLLSRMSAPQAARDLPAEMLCPSDHRAKRQIFVISLSLTSDTAVEPTELEIPIWICQACMVGYRFQECRLVPGEEGHA